MATDKTKDELYAEAQDLDIDGRSDMNKDELAEAVEDAGGDAGTETVETETEGAAKPTEAPKTVPGPGAREDDRSPSQIRPKESPFKKKD